MVYSSHAQLPYLKFRLGTYMCVPFFQPPLPLPRGLLEWHNVVNTDIWTWYTVCIIQLSRCPCKESCQKKMPQTLSLLIQRYKGAVAEAKSQGSETCLIGGQNSSIWYGSGADPGFFLGGGALVSCSTSTPINHIVFFWQNTSCIENRRSSRGGGGCASSAPSP